MQQTFKDGRDDDDHSFRIKKLRILSEAEPALPDICTRPLIAAPVSRLS